MASSHDLDALQRDLLAAFFAREQAFALTGGAALVGFYLHHRQTKDLDLFGRPGVDIELGVRALRDVSASLGGSIETLRDFRDFKRFIVRRGQEATIVDLVIDHAPAIEPPTAYGQVLVSTLRELAANKVCTVLSRSEPRDLVDLMLILRAGQDLDVALADANRKDGGVDPASLAWVLGEIGIGAEAVLPADIAPSELEQFRHELERELRRRAVPPK